MRRMSYGGMALLITSTMLGSLARPAEAQTGTTKPVAVYLSRQDCLATTYDNGHNEADETYVVALTINLQGTATWCQTLVSPKVDAHKGDHYGYPNPQAVRLWGPAPVPNVNDLIFLIAPMESDVSGKAEEVRNQVQQVVNANLSYNKWLYTTGQISRASLVEIFINQMNKAIDDTRHAGDEEDDRIGGTQELRLTVEAVTYAALPTSGTYTLAPLWSAAVDHDIQGTGVYRYWFKVYKQ